MITQFTSASASKYLKSLQEEKDFLLDAERKNCTYDCAVNEEAQAPEYSYEETRLAIEDIDARVLKIRHALHIFNINTMLPNGGITIDEALVRMAQLSEKKKRLSAMCGRNPRERKSYGYFSRESNILEYTYTNYDVSVADKDYRETCKAISDMQLELDLINQTKTFDVDL